MFTKIIKYFLIIISINLYLYLAFLHSNTFNTNVDYPDQKPYVDTAIQIKTEGFWYLGDRNRMPIYPHIMSLFYSPKMSIDQFFEVGKTVNILLSLVCIFFVYKVVSKYLKTSNMVGFIAVIAFALFVLKAGYFQVEDLFYTFYFLTFISFVKTIKSPSIKNGLTTGALTAVTYLTKATVFLGFLIFLAFLLLQTIINFYNKSKGDAKLNFTTLISSVLIFLVILFPYLNQNKKIYGEYFYNTGTTFYIWYDSIQEAYQSNGTAKNGETTGWPSLPKEEIPSPTRYFESHSPSQILQRFEVGLLRTTLFMVWTYAVIPLSFLCLYLFFFVFQGFLQKDELVNLVRKNSFLVWFLVVFWGLHLLAFSWYAVIDSGPRFILTLFIPTIFILNLTLQKIDGPKKYLKYFNFLIILILLISLKVSIIPILKEVYTGF